MGTPPTYTNPDLALTFAAIMSRPAENRLTEAAEIFRSILRDNPNKIADVSIRIGYPVSCLAAMMATGQEINLSDPVPPKDRDEWAYLAAFWLSCEIKRVQELAKSMPDLARRYARLIFNEPRFNHFQQRDFQTQLPESIQKMWAENWQRLDELTH